MPTILVSGLVQDGDRTLFLRSEGGMWDLPGGTLAENETTEEALRRHLFTDYGILVGEEQFVDTFFEGGTEATGPCVRNIYRVDTWSGRPAIHASGNSTELVWVPRDHVADLPLTEAVRLGLGIMAGPFPVGSPGWLPRVLVLTGLKANASGTVGVSLHDRLRRVAYIDAAVVWAMGPAAAPKPQIQDGIRLTNREIDLDVANTVALVRNFVSTGLDVVLELPRLSQELLDRYLSSLEDIAPVELIGLGRADGVLSDIGEDEALTFILAAIGEDSLC